MRTVSIWSTQLNTKKVIQSAATTWGELKSEIPDLSPDAMSAVVQQTKNGLDFDDSTLPEGDFLIFLTPKQMKSGLN